MNFEKIELTLKNNISFKLLRSKNNSLIIAFLYKEFKEKNQVTISNHSLINKLENFIENEYFFDDNEDTDNYTKAYKYLEEWTEQGYLRKYSNEKGEPVNEITSAVEKVFQWFESLEKREFIGTESRFKDIFYKLKDLASGGIDDPEKKIKELEEQKKDIEQQIKFIKKNKKVKSFDDYQIKSRFHEVNMISRELLSDFKEVEENFKQITRKIYENQSKKDFSKGNILKYTFDSLDELKESDQGKSFYAFWNFLIDENKQDDLEFLIDQVFKLIDEREIEINDFFLKKIKTYLHLSARKVLGTNTLLADKLTRIISEKEIIDKKIALQTINEIKKMALSFIDKDISEQIKVSMELTPHINLPMEKKLGEETKKTDFKIEVQDFDTEEYFKDADLTKLFNKNTIDKKQLLQNIHQMLRLKEQISLKEVIDEYPVNKGLAEIICYISFTSNSKKFFVNEDKNELIEFDKANKKFLEVPQVIFTR